jgi:hypothetical protein
MVTRVLHVALLLLIAVSSFGSDFPVAVEPPDPTSITPVTLIVTQFDTCPPRPTVTRNGFVINVHMGYGICLSPPTLITHRLDIGVLPAGDYLVNVMSGDEIVTTARFTVLDANGLVVVGPAIGTIAGGTDVFIEADVTHCAGHQVSDCAPPLITFNGVPARNVVAISSRQFRASTPPGKTGAALVTVATGDQTRSSFAFTYYDPAAAPMPQLFEKILIPVFYNGPGVAGSSWATEVAVRNEYPYAITPWRTSESLPSFAPDKAYRIGFDAAPSGVFITVPRGSAAGLHFNAMIRDTSRALQAWGTELPVARESDFASSVTLLNVPVYPEFRTQLRIYSASSVRTFATVTVESMDTGQVLRRFAAVLTSPEPCIAVVPCASQHPAFASITDLLGNAQISPSERLAVRVEGAGVVPVWAFATITNNVTQHATVISPQ